MTRLQSEGLGRSQVWSKQGSDHDEEVIFGELPHGLRLEVGWLMSRRVFAADPVRPQP